MAVSTLVAARISGQSHTRLLSTSSTAAGIDQATDFEPLGLDRADRRLSGGLEGCRGGGDSSEMPMTAHRWRRAASSSGLPTAAPLAAFARKLVRSRARIESSDGCALRLWGRIRLRLGTAWPAAPRSARAAQRSRGAWCRFCFVAWGSTALASGRTARRYAPSCIGISERRGRSSSGTRALEKFVGAAVVAVFGVPVRREDEVTSCGRGSRRSS